MIAVDHDRAVLVRPRRKRKAPRKRDGRDTTDRAHALEQLVLEAVCTRRIIASGKQTHRGSRDICRRKSRISGKQSAETRHHEPRADQENDAQAHLHDDQRGAKVTAAARHRPRRCRAHRGREIEARHVQRRRESEYQCRSQSDRDRCRQHAEVEVSREHKRDAAARRKEESQRVAREIGEHQPRDGTEQRKDEPFR